jgi:hypothetical protein
MADGISDWPAYEDAAMEFFQELGLPATRGKTVRAARAKHRIDVPVEFERFGVGQLWVLECKLRKTRVENRMC